MMEVPSTDLPLTAAAIRSQQAPHACLWNLVEVKRKASWLLLLCVCVCGGGGGARGGSGGGGVVCFLVCVLLLLVCLIKKQSVNTNSVRQTAAENTTTDKVFVNSPLLVFITLPALVGRYSSHSTRGSLAATTEAIFISLVATALVHLPLALLDAGPVPPPLPHTHTHTGLLFKEGTGLTKFRCHWHAWHSVGTDSVALRQHPGPPDTIQTAGTGRLQPQTSHSRSLSGASRYFI